MGKVNYKHWAKEIWGEQPFSYTSGVKGQPTVLIRYRTNVQLMTMEHGGTWQRSMGSTVADTLVPAVRWLTLVVHRPTLVEIIQNDGDVFRIVVTTDAPAKFDNHGQPQPSGSQVHYMMRERVKEIVGCDARRAKLLAEGIRDEASLLIIEFANNLLKKYDNQPEHAKNEIERLWGGTPEQICIQIPHRFHPLATTRRHLKIKNALLRCIDLMAS